MNKRFLFGFILGLVAVAAAVMWLLSLVPATSEAMKWFTLGWAVVIVAGTLGIAYLLRGLLSKAPSVIKKLNIGFGAGFVCAALAALVNELAWSGQLLLPIIAVVLTVALLLGYLAVGGGKWDSGDNQKAGYKNYYERKAEEEKAEKDKNNK